MNIQMRLKTNSADWSVGEVPPILEPAYSWLGMTIRWTAHLDSLSS